MMNGASVMMINPDSLSIGGRGGGGDWRGSQLSLGEILG